MPAVVLTGEDECTGSCRSYGDFDLHQALSKCKQHLTSFGGHQMAAGVKLREYQIHEFRKTLQSVVPNTIEAKPINVDLDVAISELTITEVENLIRQTEPFGEGNPAPVFRVTGMTTEPVRMMGSDMNHAAIRVTDASKANIRMTGFFMPELADLKLGSNYEFIFSPVVNEFGYKKAEGRIIEVNPCV